MGLLDDIMAMDGVNLIADTDSGAEPLIFYPTGSNGPPRNINGQVFRDPNRFYEKAPEARRIQIATFKMIVLVANDNVYGISGDELNLGGQQLTVPDTTNGDTTTTYTIQQKVHDDSAGLALAVS